MKSKSVVASALVCIALLLGGCSMQSAQQVMPGPSQGSEEVSPEPVKIDPLDNIKVESVKCEDWPGNAQVMIRNDNSEMYGVSLTIAFVHEDGTVADTVSEYPNLPGNKTTRLVVNRPENISFSTCELADLQLLEPMD